MRRVVIGSRGSELALAQTNHMSERIRAVAPDVEVVVEIFSTKGDKVTDIPLAKIGGKGLFTKELESALLDGSIDLAVHSLKDLPTELPAGLCLACVPEREDPRDALITREGLTWETLPQGARVGTSSLRRKVQLLAVRPDLEIVDLRGNVPTRIKKLTTQGLDAIVLACSGLKRLGLDAHITHAMGAGDMLPAVGQGALGLETRENDTELREVLSRIHDAQVYAEVRAERALLNALGGGCQTPLAALATTHGEVLTLQACIASASGDQVLRLTISGTTADPEALGRAAAVQFLRDGARSIIQRAVNIAVHGNLPLAGKKILVTRARKQAGGLAEELSTLGADVITLPLIEIVAVTPPEVPIPHAGDWVIFTSVNAVEHYLHCLEDPDILHAADICAIGPGTLTALQERGIPVTLTPRESIAESIVESLRVLEGGLAEKRFILPHGNLARNVIYDALCDAGAIVEEVVVYETVKPDVSDTEIDAMLAARPDLVCFTSSSTVTNLDALLGAERRRQLEEFAAYASIGPLTSGTAEGLGMRMAFTADQHDIPGLIGAILSHFNPS